jgi:Fe-S-cluster containining protein
MAGKLTVEKKLYELYDDYDGLAKEGIALAERNTGLKVQCTRGCAHCCKLPVLCGISEGSLIAKELLRLIEWDVWVDRLIEASKPYLAARFDRKVFFAGNHVCPFLNDETSDCQIYSYRPPACRWYYALSPPEMCSQPNTSITCVDLITLEMDILRYNQYVLQRDPIVAPLPLMAVFMMEAVANPARQKLIGQAILGKLLNPNEWFQKYVVTGNYDLDDSERARAYKMASMMLEKPNSEIGFGHKDSGT